MAHPFEVRVKNYGKGKAKLSSTLKLIFGTENPSKWRSPQSKANKDDKKTKEEEKDQHAADNGEMTANLSKAGNGGKYKENFSEFIKSDDRKSVYKTISGNIKLLHGTSRLPLIDFFNDYFALDKLNCNFNYKGVLSKAHSGNKNDSKAGCSKPYKWEAHHLIPGEAFYTKDSSGVFTVEQHKLLEMSDYDINTGHNIIALPANRMDFFQPVHDLIQHPSNHSNYTKKVKKEMMKISDDLEELVDESEENHPDIKVEIAKRLKGLEDDFWDLLIRLGKALITAKVSKIKLMLNKEDDELVKFSASTGTQYSYGALA